MANFVLVHGGWHGGWCWDRVAPLVRAAGHRVWAPTLTGLAEKVHLLTPETDLETHIGDIVDLFRDVGIEDAILVGHSYAGMVISGVADRIPGQIAQLVFLDAIVAEDGQSQYDLLPSERREYYRQRARNEGDGWRVPPPPPEAMGITDPAEAAWLRERMTFHPLRALEQPVQLTGVGSSLPRSYIQCTTGPVVASFAPFADRASASRDWDVYELETGHDAMLTAPVELSATLLRIAATDR
jgi:pimeloyl-ACP methyl ester carboxylesterase